MEKRETIKQYLIDNWSSSDFVGAWNECSDAYNLDDIIFINDEEFINSHFRCADDAVRAVCNGDYWYTDDFAILDGYENLVSFNHYDAPKSPFDMNVLLDWVIKTGYGIDKKNLLATIVDSIVPKTGADWDEAEKKVSDFISENEIDIVEDDWGELEKFIEENFK